MKCHNISSCCLSEVRIRSITANCRVIITYVGGPFPFLLHVPLYKYLSCYALSCGRRNSVFKYYLTVSVNLTVHRKNICRGNLGVSSAIIL